MPHHGAFVMTSELEGGIFDTITNRQISILVVNINTPFVDGTSAHAPDLLVTKSWDQVRQATRWRKLASSAFHSSSNG